MRPGICQSRFIFVPGCNKRRFCTFLYHLLLTMARLTSFSRLLIAGAIGVGAFFLISKFMPQIKSAVGAKSDTTTTATSPAPANDGTESAPTSGGTSAPQATTAPSASRQPFNFTPLPPVNGKMRGVVELGATGFNSFIVRMDGQKNWKLEKAEFGTSLVHENMASETDIRDGLKQYINKMVEYGVGGRDIHFVVSSGAMKEEVTSRIISVLKTMNYYVNTVTPEREAQLGFLSAMPRGYESKAFVADIGSGNTKMSWMEGGKLKGVESHGSKYYQNNLSDDAVARDIKTKAAQLPSFARNTCFIIGGVPFELAKKIRNGKERYTVLNAPGEYQMDGAKQKAGLNIYKALADATGCRQFIFDWDANFTIGFLLEMK